MSIDYKNIGVMNNQLIIQNSAQKIIGMRKYILNDRKSNLNTSCASDSYSSLLSSAYEVNITESLAKIEQLKKLYMQTCEEQIVLQKQNTQLKTTLGQHKSKLEQLLSNKYTNTQASQIKKANPKALKPGTITKIQRSKQQKNQHNIKNCMDTIEADDPEIKQNQSKTWKRSPRNTPHSRRQSLMPERAKNEFDFDMDCEKFRSEKVVDLKKHRYHQSMEFNVEKSQHVSNKFKESQWKPNADMEFMNNLNFKKQEVKVKSYLNSPRGSVVGSPRHFYLG